MQTKEAFDTKYKKLADEILLPFLIQEHRTHTPEDKFIQEKRKFSREELLKHYNCYDYYDCYYYNCYDYYYYYFAEFPFVEFMKLVAEVIQKAAVED